MTGTGRRDPFAQPGFDGKDPLDLIPVAKKVVRQRTWEKKNKSFSYRIPQRLRDEAIEVRESILSIATFDENGDLRMDRTTVDDIAKALLGYALKKSREESLSFTPARTGKMKIEWKEAEQGWEHPVVLKKVEKKKKKAQPKQLVLSYRWSAESHADIERMAGEIHAVRHRDDGRIKNHPHRFSVPPGEVVVRLLQRAITAYKERKMILTTRPETAGQKVTGWAER